MDFLERIDAGYLHETWLVRDGGELATARVFETEDVEYNQMVATRTARWLGFRHPRVVPLRALSPVVPLLVITSGDERGPSILRAAMQLAEAGIDREAWAVHEIAALADAVTAMSAFDAGFIHRRANPEQIVVGADGHARLRAPIAYVSVGSAPTYLGRGPSISGIGWLSPEQIRGEVLSPASDVYQLATTLYSLLTGAPLARGSSDYERLRSIIDRTTPPDVPARTPGLAALVQRALARAPDERPADPAAFAAALRALGVAEPPPGAREVASRPVHPAPARSAAVSAPRCAKAWDQLAPTTTDGVRHCASCRNDVVRVSSVLALVPLLGRRCVSFVPDEN